MNEWENERKGIGPNNSQSSHFERHRFSMLEIAAVKLSCRAKGVTLERGNMWCLLDASVASPLLAELESASFDIQQRGIYVFSERFGVCSPQRSRPFTWCNVCLGSVHPLWASHARLPARWELIGKAMP